jgi:sugar lactone lactonase YvrE
LPVTLAALARQLALAGVERLATGCRFNEGAVYFGDARCLLWSDIPNNRIMRWGEETGRISIFRQPSNHANGNTRDREGRLITCEHSGRRITRTEYDGTIAVLIRFDGKRLNGTNDVVVHERDPRPVTPCAVTHPALSQTARVPRAGPNLVLLVRGCADQELPMRVRVQISQYTDRTVREETS